MKVLLIARNTLFTVPGGDTIQVIETAAHLRKLGIFAEVQLTGMVKDYKPYQLLHFFNIIRPCDILPHIRKSKLPFVVSPVFVDYSGYDKHMRKGLSGFLFRFLPPDTIEYLKNLLRKAVSKNKEPLPFQYLLRGHSRSVKSIALNAGYLLPNSENEYLRFQERYQIKVPYSVVPNGINSQLFKENGTDEERDPLLVLCVARIEGIKNQLTLIKALNNTRYKLLLIGNAAPNQLSYYKKCRETAASNITFINHLPQDELLGYYRKAKVHILPSWFETTGLSSLEAAVMGCNIVVSKKGDVQEYFSDHAFYCDPSSPASILTAVEKASHSSVNPNLRTYILEHYTWEKAAQKTMEVYQKVLNPDKVP